MSATVTPHISKKLESYLDYYQPHLVIMMMGINDYKNLHHKKLDSTFFNLKIFKLARYIKKAIGSLSNEQGEALNKYEEFLVRAFRRELGNKSTIEGLELYKEFLNKAKNKITLSAVLIWDLIEQGKIEHADIMVNYAIKEFPMSDAILGRYMFSKDHIGEKKNCAQAAFNYLDNGGDLDQHSFSILSLCALVSDEYKQKFQTYFPEFHFGLPNPFYHHIQMAKKIRGRGIKVLFMQYPKQSIIPLKNAQGENDPSIFFLENKSNFVELEKIHGFDDIYLDRFAGNWGHTTELGHITIAKNIEEFLKSQNLFDKTSD